MPARYLQLAEDIVIKISEGSLPLGQRMPSLRQFAKLHEVSKTTAINCYTHLQSLGWLLAKPQSGFFTSKPLDQMAAPVFPRFKSTIRVPKTFNENEAPRDAAFANIQLSSELTPYQAMARCFSRSQRRNAEKMHLYPDAQGQGKLRQALAQHFSDQYFPLDGERLIITNGCLDAIRTAIDVTSKEGDTIAISSPCFNGLLKLLAIMNRRVLEIPCHGSALDLKQLEEQLRQKNINACLLSANHINPQGFCLSPKQKEKIAHLAEKYKTPVIEDDVFLELSYNKTSPLPIKHWDKKGWVLWCGSISKTLSAGYRLGWCEPGRFLSKYLEIRSAQTLGTNLPVQYALYEFIISGQYLYHLKKLSLHLVKRALQYHHLLKEHLPKNTRISAPEGGLAIWLQIPGLDARLLLEEAKTKNIYFSPGHVFSTQNLYNDCLRLNIGYGIDSKSHEPRSRRNFQDLMTLCELICLQLDEVWV